MNHADALALVAILRRQYPSTVFPADSAEQYARFLVDLDAAEVAAAIAIHIATDPSSFIPAVGVIRNLVAERRAKLPSAEEAWGVVLKQIAKGGRNHTPVFDHEAIARAVKRLGWTTLCNSDNVAADRAHFYRTYESERKNVLVGENLGATSDRYAAIAGAVARAVSDRGQPLRAIAEALGDIIPARAEPVPANRAQATPVPEREYRESPADEARERGRRDK